MLKMLSQRWWIILVRGLAAIVFGFAALLWPGLTLSILVLLFGAYALIDGLSALITAVAARGDLPSWWVHALEGAAGILAGGAALLWPNITGLLLLYLIAVWAILTGLVEIIAAFQLRHDIEGEWWLIVAGMASIAFGVLAFVYPAAGALSLLSFITAYAFVFGAALVLLAFRVRSLARRPAEF